MTDVNVLVYSVNYNRFAYIKIPATHILLGGPCFNTPERINKTIFNEIESYRNIIGEEIYLATAAGLFTGFIKNDFSKIVPEVPNGLIDAIRNYSGTITKHTLNNPAGAYKWYYTIDLGTSYDESKSYTSIGSDIYYFSTTHELIGDSSMNYPDSPVTVQYYNTAGYSYGKTRPTVYTTVEYDVNSDFSAILDEFVNNILRFYTNLNIISKNIDTNSWLNFANSPRKINLFASLPLPLYKLTSSQPLLFGHNFEPTTTFSANGGYRCELYWPALLSAVSIETGTSWSDYLSSGGARTYPVYSYLTTIYDKEAVDGGLNVASIIGISDFVNNVFGGVPPVYSEDLQNEIDDAAKILNPKESIYSPGGDSSDPHNPYPSGSSPYTVDPLDSGVETDSPNTDGTWGLPFDNVPDNPSTVHSVNLGLYNAYALSAAQVMELANYLFSGITEVGENLVKLIWGSKRDVVISLIEFPLMVTNQGVEEIRFIFDTALAGMFHGKQLTNEYLPINFGTIEVPRYSGTFYDFEPYTTLTLYIPYIGYIDLKPTEVIGSTLTISGYVHLTTGEINVNVKSSRTGILGSYSGTIGRMLPIADADATEIYSAIIKTAASLGAVAVAGVGASSAAATAASIGEPSTESVEVASANYVNAIEAWGAADDNARQYSAEMKIASHDYQKARNSYSEAKSKYNQVSKAASNSQEAFHDAISEAGSNTLDAVTTGFTVSRGTVMTSSNGRLSPQRCFLRIEVPHQNVSRNQKILGYPANSSDSLNSNRLHGYTELRTIELSIPRATLTELQELENILKGGFYLP